jgi:sec-independent protein translocase protein TatA
MFGIGFAKLLLIVLLATLVFGARRLPEVGAGLGKAIKNFKAALSGEDEIDVTPKKDEIADGKGPKP